MKVTFHTENAAFTDNRSDESIRILQMVIRKIAIGHKEGIILDINGNTIGSWGI